MRIMNHCTLHEVKVQADMKVYPETNHYWITCNNPQNIYHPTGQHKPQGNLYLPTL